MSKPILKSNDLISIISDSIELLKNLDNKIAINFNHSKDKIFFNSDSEQISRVFVNLIKNSIESLHEKSIDMPHFNKKINIEIFEKDDYIESVIVDNGKGLSGLKDNIKSILNPYFTTKKKGTGLGLAIVNKIINDHNGSIKFIQLDIGVKILIRFKKI